MEHHNHGSPSFINIAVLLLFAVVIAVASTAATYYFLSSKTTEQPPIIQPPVIPPVQTNVVPTTPATMQTTIPADETADWKTVKMFDSISRLGYEVKAPPDWSINKGFEGGHSTPNPVELTLRFESKSCALQTVDYISIMHFLSSNPTASITDSINSLKENGYMSSFIKTGDGISVERLSDQNYIYVSIPTIKGYYYITGGINCDKYRVEQIFNQIISTFKFTE